MTFGFRSFRAQQWHSKFPTPWTGPTCASDKRPINFLVPCMAYGLIVLLAGCATSMTVPESLNRPTSQPDARPLAVPPGTRLEKFALCYEETRPGGVGVKTAPKRHAMHVGMLVALDDCVALSGNGWLSVVPGQCRPPVSAQTDCETENVPLPP